MDNSGLMSHIAMTIDQREFTNDYISNLESFYKGLLGWTVNKQLSIDGERLLLNLPGHGQYLNVRAAEHPMSTTSYEHIGVYVENADTVRSLFAKVQSLQQSDNRIELDDRGVQVLYGGALTTFRFHYLLPLSVELQHIASSGT